MPSSSLYSLWTTSGCTGTKTWPLFYRQHFHMHFFYWIFVFCFNFFTTIWAQVGMGLISTHLITACDSKHIKILRMRQNGHYFTDNTFKWIFLNENVCISIKISLKLDPRVLVNNNSALVQIMAWCWTGNKPLSEPMTVVNLLMHVWVTWPQCPTSNNIC